MTAEIAATAAEAWHALQSRGLEVPGRDDDLVDLLHTALLGSTRGKGDVSFDDLLNEASLEQFVRAFFRSATPFVDMLKDILKWFEQADAKRGPRGWQLAWDGGDLPELQQFRNWLQQLQTRAIMVEHPAVAFVDCWTLIEKLSVAPGAMRSRELIGKQNYRGLPESIRDFAYGYEYGYDDLSTLPTPGAGQPWLLDILNIIRHALAELELEGISGRKEALARAQQLSYARTKENGLAFDSLCMLETDLWILHLVACYDAILASPADQAAVGPDIQKFFATMPRMTFLVDDSIQALSAFLDLPLWSRRHEFFSAWIASKIIDACGEHEQELLHDQGVIALPFKSTVVARIRSAQPERTLFSERRSGLKDPKGKGRSENVQPDFGIWHTTTSGDICDLVVEVKHYLNPAKASWVDVLEDYAAAHPAATVLLVNYGRPGNAMNAVSSGFQSRCRVIGNVRPGQQAALDELAELVQKAVGPVFKSAPASRAHVPGAPVAVVLDRSYSMKAERATLHQILSQYVDAYAASHVAVAALRGASVWEANTYGVQAVVDSPQNSETQFTDILAKMLIEHPEIIFITDADGKRGLDEGALYVHVLATGPGEMEVVRVTMQ